MTSRTKILGVAFALISSGALAASPTPTFKTGNYSGLRTLVAVGDRTAYGGDGVSAAVHPTTIRYDAASQTYTLYDYDGGPGYIYSPSKIVASQTTAAYTFYRDPGTGSTLKLLNLSASNPVIVLSYVTYGKWSVPQSAPIHFADNYMVFGQLTPVASMPRSGSASYKAILDGPYQKGASTYRLGGSALFTANFASGTMGVTATPVGTNVSTGAQLGFGQLTGVGNIYFDSSGFSTYSKQTAADGSKIRFDTTGNFYGPSANEIGGAFTIRQTLGTTQIGEGGGAVVGKRN
jgi:hypothetical protein